MNLQNHKLSVGQRINPEIGMRQPVLEKRKALIALLALSSLSVTPVVLASENNMEEVVVTARMRAESLQDVPVTVSALNSETIERYQIDRVDEIASRVPNFRVTSGGSGSSGSLRLRGVGSSAISAAFDSAVAFNLDGVMANTMRLVQNSFMDVEQVEVLKGPQSLYFGKSASAGVLSITSKNPGDEFEASISAAYEGQYDTMLTSGFVSGPLTEKVAARLAFQYKDTDELYQNSAPGVVNPTRGEESLDMRLTLTADITDTLAANFKYAISRYENDGQVIYSDIECVNPSGLAQGTNFAGATGVPSGQDCNQYDDVQQRGDGYAAQPQLQAGFSDGRFVPFGEQDVNLARLQLRWDASESIRLTSITGYYNLDDFAGDSYSYDVTGYGYSTSKNQTDSFSQEFRIESDYDGRFNFLLGAYYQDREIVFDTDQLAFGLAVFGGPDPDGGRTHDWKKVHTTDTKAVSVFGSFDYLITDDLELSAGVRWTDEEKTNVVSTPFVHFFLGFLGLPNAVSSGFVSPDIDFQDDNISPEVSLSYTVNDDVMIYGAYKTGFKSGGIDNSALPTNLSTTALPGLIYQSEEADGFEFGIKSMLLENSLRLNATIYAYQYDDLQVQEFDAVNIQFQTFNAGTLDSEGVEIDASWTTDVEGLTLSGALAYTNAPFSSSFVVDGTDELNGQQIAGNAKWAGNFVIDYYRPIGNSNMAWGLNAAFLYSDEYNADNSSTSFVQDSYVTTDATAYIVSQDGKWQLSIIGTNLSDERYTIGSGARPFADISGNPSGRQDQVHGVSRGRMLSFEGRYNF
ncbi:MAG: TonB-dependent receptor [Pseudomonadales bacterium]|nr:TonB-dependent receptor [Pseudomonadales bacterium]